VDARFTPGWREVFDLPRAMQRRNRPGMPGPREVKKQIARWHKELARHD